MGWYSANLIIGYIDQNDDQSLLMAEESVRLFQAASCADALELANAVGVSLAKIDDNVTIDGKFARRVFVGVRKVVETCNLVGEAQDAPKNECELTYNFLHLSSRDDLERFTKGEEGISISVIE